MQFLFVILTIIYYFFSYTHSPRFNVCGNVIRVCVLSLNHSNTIVYCVCSRLNIVYIQELRTKPKFLEWLTFWSGKNTITTFCVCVCLCECEETRERKTKGWRNWKMHKRVSIFLLLGSKYIYALIEILYVWLQ